ncbi:MAG: caspase family protein [Myxococcota bacterium]
MSVSTPARPFRRFRGLRPLVAGLLVAACCACATARDPERLARDCDLPALERALGPSPAPEAARAAFVAAMDAERTAVVRWLLDGRIDVTATDARGRTLLHDAATRATPETIEALARAGAPLQARAGASGTTPLALAAAADHAAGVYGLVRSGANVDLPDRDGLRRTPLHTAVAAGAAHAVRLLLQAGADPYAPDANGDSPLSLASATASPEIHGMFRLALSGRADAIPLPARRAQSREAAGGSATRFLTRRREEAESAEAFSLADLARGQGLRASAARPRSGANRAKATEAYGRRVAAIIGIDDYARWPDLEGARRDARRLAAELRAQGFDEILELYDGEATRSRILSLLGQELSEKTRENDLAFIFFAGHGDTQTLEDGSKRGYILPVDASPGSVPSTGISMAQLRDFSDRLRAKHVFYAMDSCYSGLGLTRGVGLVRPDEANYITKVTSQRAVQMLTAGTEGELAIERDGQGLFTTYLVRALRGEADFDGDGVVTAGEIGVFVRPQVSAASENRQTPQFGTLAGTGEVVFPLP